MAVVRSCLCKLLNGGVSLAARPSPCRTLSAVATTLPKTQQPDTLYKRVHLELCGHDKAVLQSYCTVLTTAAKHLDISTEPLTMSKKPELQRLTLLKSVHIYKKHRVQYEMRTHRANLSLQRLTGSTADTYLEYIQRFLPEGISLKVTRVALERLPEYIRPPNKTTE